MSPTQEQIACFLHQALTLHHPLFMVCVNASPPIRLEYRCICFLDLKKQRVVSIASCHQQHDPGARSHTAHSNHFASDVDEVVFAEQHPMIIRQRLRVGIKILFDSFTFIFDVHDQWWLILNAVLSIHFLSHLRKDAQTCTSNCLLFLSLKLFPLFAFHHPRSEEHTSELQSHSDL